MKYILLTLLGAISIAQAQPSPEKTKPPVSSEKRVEVAMKKADTNQDGLISKEEFEVFIKSRPQGPKGNHPSGPPTEKPMRPEPPKGGPKGGPK